MRAPCAVWSICRVLPERDRRVVPVLFARQPNSAFSPFLKHVGKTRKTQRATPALTLVPCSSALEKSKLNAASVVPTPAGVLHGVTRCPAGKTAVLDKGRLALRRYKRRLFGFIAAKITNAFSSASKSCAEPKKNQPFLLLISPRNEANL